MDLKGSEWRGRHSSYLGTHEVSLSRQRLPFSGVSCAQSNVSPSVQLSACPLGCEDATGRITEQRRLSSRSSQLPSQPSHSCTVAMRRSAAPSKRFAPPARTSTAALATRPAPGPTVTAAGHTNGSAGERASGPPAASNKASANRTPLAPVKRPASAAAGSRPPQAAASRKRFAAPQRTRPVQDPRADAGAEGGPEERYFSGVWCKASKKKHKKWEGDCLLVVRGRSVRLKDSEGKDIGTSKNMRAADLKTLRVGETL